MSEVENPMSEQGSEEKDSGRTHPQQPAEGNGKDEENEAQVHPQEPAEGGQDQT
ncbi:hypothetical protein MUK71_03190 [Arthrobacter zhangbolii]|uniref:Uncharacterized protein n=1 Tax=Arthrobacter zhangbolii TaxID=2886936 RepID=A0A9X1SAE5_9MICC|nr:hypothetical protein [Arthrobacter zhangbolii]MCC3273357.1 hypothetical protein [Arthrobacter zhangbolii]MCC3295979.1 hypothetical protein [Arthrobacter zhangbolii]UON92664.1 hypothetical protein MUK71_03190 [Arthrobacter zhangbolii]